VNQTASGVSIPIFRKVGNLKSYADLIFHLFLSTTVSASLPVIGLYTWN